LSKLVIEFNFPWIMKGLNTHENGGDFGF